MGPSNSSQVQKLFEAALKREPQLRLQWLQEQCVDNEALLNAVLDRLDEDDGETIQVVQAKNSAPTTHPTRAHRKPAGRLIGSWQLVHRLGEGGMGAVWLAQRVDGELEMQASVKLVRPERAGPDFLARFRRERQIMADLKHPYIGTLLDAGTTEEGQPYLVMEYVDGDTLTRFCDTHVPEQPQRIQLFRMVCEAVAFAHRKGVIHRDIKPANIMVSKEGIPKLLDFGIAYLNDPAKDYDRLSRPGQVAMTPEYASPELLHGGVAGVASDIYALGLVLVELAVGKRPRDLGKDTWASIDNHLGDVPQLAELLKTTLAEKPDQRYGSVPELIEALDHAMGSAEKETTVFRRFDALVWFHPRDNDRAKELALLLEARHGLSLWLPGRDGDQLRAILSESACLLVCVGNGEPWQNSAQRTAIEEEISKQRVVPLLLEEARRPERESSLPAFLRRSAWLNQSDSENLARAIRGLIIETPSGETTETCPFRGLEVFREEDRKFFFGREAMTQRLTEHVAQHRFLAVLGPSGSGKSSVVQAGLIPHLRQQGCAIAMCTPSAHPLRELAFALYPMITEQDPERLHQRLQAGDQALAFITRQLCFIGDCDQVYLIIDQFEEIFTLASDKDEVKLFLACLFHAVEQQDSGLSVVLTLRSDFVGKCIIWPDLNDYLTEHIIQVKTMDTKELQQAINEPARLAHLHFEEGLVDRILEDIGGASAELPLMEHALMELWARRRGRLMTLAAYVEIGGIEGALAKRAENEYEQLDEAQQQVLRKMFTLCLVHPGEGSEGTRRRAARKDLLAIGGDAQISEVLLQRFVTARLLTTQRDESQNTDMVDVAHEALIRKWPRIKSWMGEDRETARLIERLRRRAKAWDEAGREKDHLFQGGLLAQMSDLINRERSSIGALEQTFVKAGLTQRRRRKQMAITIGSLGFVLAAISFFLFIDARSARQVALKAQQIAEAEKTKAQQQTLEANYNLGLVYGLQAKDSLDGGDARKAWTLSLRALSQGAPVGKNMLKTRGLFPDPRMKDAELLLWTSPVLPKLTRLAAQPHGNLLALAGRHTGIHLINQQTGMQERLLTEGRNSVEDLEFSLNGQWMAAAFNGDEICLWRAPDWDFVILDKDQKRNTLCLAFSRNSELLAAGREDGSVIILNLKDKLIIKKWDLGSPVNDLVFGEDETLYMGTEDGLWMDVGSRNKPERLRDEGISCLSWWKLGYVGIDKHGQLLMEEGDIELRHGKVEKVIAGPSGKRLLIMSDGVLMVFDAGTTISNTLFERVEMVDLSLNNQGIVNLIEKGGTLLRFDIDNGDILPEAFGHSSDVSSIVFSPDGKTMASGSWDGTIILWDCAGEQPPRVLQGHSAGVTSLAFSPSGANLVSASFDQTVRLWDVARAISFEVLQGHSDRVYGVAFSPDGTRIASASSDQTVRLWDVARATPLEVLKGHSGIVMGVAFSPDNARLASASYDQTVRIWDVTRATPPEVLKGHSSGVIGVAFSPDGTRLASASYDKTVRLWNVTHGTPLETLRHSDFVNGVAFSPDGARLASASSDKTVRLWDVAHAEVLETFHGHSSIYSVAFSPDNTQLASASRDKTVRLWDVTQTSPLEALPDHSAPVYNMVFSLDGTRLASIFWDQTLRLWDVVRAEPLGVLQGHSAPIRSVAFSPDGTRLVSGSQDKTVRLWDVANATPLGVLRGHSAIVSDVVFSPDGSQLASASYDKTVRLWDVACATPLKVLQGHSAQVYGVAFSPDGARLASASQDKTVRLWDTARLAPVELLQGHLGPVYSLAFSPDGTRLASASEDKTVRLWDVARAVPLDTFWGHSRVIFSPDGRLLASITEDRTIQIWNVPDGKALAVLNDYEARMGLAFAPLGTLLVIPPVGNANRLWHLDRLLEPPPKQPAQEWYGELLNRSLHHMGYRLDGFQLHYRPLIRLYGSDLEPSGYDHLDKPRPPQISLTKWLMKGYEPSQNSSSPGG